MADGAVEGAVCTGCLGLWLIDKFSSFQTIYAAKALAQNGGSKIAKENFDVFCDNWESQINELSILVKDINDVLHGKNEKNVYMSLPRPGVCTCLGDRLD
jgi:hypothetical protein